MRIRQLVLAAAAVSMVLVAAASATTETRAATPIVLTNLKAPRGLTASESYVLVAEQGGNILQVSELGSVGTVISGLPTVTADSPEGPLTAGPSAVIRAGDTYYFILPEAEDRAGFDSIYSVKPGGKPVLIADLGPYEAANNLDGAKDETGAPDLVVNPYDLIMDGAGGLLVSASGMNAVVRISPAGQITPYAVFKARQNPLFPGIGGPEMDQVPTGIERGPDGAVYVSTLTGFPFPNGGARVYRLQDRNSDGDAMDDGEVTTYADGLTTATNLAFDKDGSLLVTEFSTNFLEQAPGRLVRVVNGKISATVAAPLISPTGVAVMNDGTVMVSQEFAGIVADAQSGARLAAAGGPPGGAPSGGITPPSTGDGGLLGQSGGAWMAYTGLLMLVAGLGAGAYVSVKR